MGLFSKENRFLTIGVILMILGLGGALIISLVFGGMRGMMGPGGMHRDGMDEVMKEMLSGRLPSGIKPENLPDPKSPGAKLMARYCTQCHDLPTPSMQTAEDWPGIVDRMFGRMKMIGGMRGMMNRHRMHIDIPSPAEEQKLLSYLQEHALKPADPKDFNSKGSKGAVLFQKICSQCHAIPDPSLHTPEEWPDVVDRMRKNGEVMGKPEITNQERDEIVGFLRNETDF